MSVRAEPELGRAIRRREVTEHDVGDEIEGTGWMVEGDADNIRYSGSVDVPDGSKGSPRHDTYSLCTGCRIPPVPAKALFAVMKFVIGLLPRYLGPDSVHCGDLLARLENSRVRNLDDERIEVHVVEKAVLAGNGRTLQDIRLHALVVQAASFRAVQDTLGFVAHHFAKVINMIYVDHPLQNQ